MSEETSKVKKTVIQRKSWVNIRIKKHFLAVFLPVLYPLLLSLFGLGGLGIFLYIFDSTLELSTSLISSVFLIAILIVGMIMAIFSIITYLSWSKFEIIITAPKYKTVADMVDVIPANITITAGIVLKKKVIHTINSVNSVLLTESLFGQIFHYGTITLSGNFNSNGNINTTLVLRNIVRPEVHLEVIRKLINDAAGDKMINPDFNEMLDSNA